MHFLNAPSALLTFIYYTIVNLFCFLLQVLQGRLTHATNLRQKWNQAVREDKCTKGEISGVFTCVLKKQSMILDCYLSLCKILHYVLLSSIKTGDKTEDQIREWLLVYLSAQKWCYFWSIVYLYLLMSQYYGYEHYVTINKFVKRK